MKQIIFILFFFLSSSLSAKQPDYELGKGLKLGQLPLYLGGYFSAEYENTNENKELSKLNELALMLYGEQDHLSYMIELEAEDIDTSSGNGSENATTLHLERFHLNYEFNENYEITMGKFNSIIGIWNQVPINVLRDTSSSPIITEQLFPKFTTGAELRYQSLNEDMFNIHMMLQEGEDLDEAINDEVNNNFDTDRHYGIGASLQHDETLYQFNAGYFQLTTRESYSYLLGAFKYEYTDFKLQGELGAQFSHGEHTIPYMGYLQGSYTFKEQHETIMRIESYDNRNIDMEETFVVFGYTYRPYYSVAIKGEYQWHTIKEENELVLSISALF